jgi:hypothetical protein
MFHEVGLLYFGTLRVQLRLERHHEQAALTLRGAVEFPQQRELGTADPEGGCGCCWREQHCSELQSAQGLCSEENGPKGLMQKFPHHDAGHIHGQSVQLLL